MDQRIDDFGAEIPGARKHRAALQLRTSMRLDPELRGGLTESWPAPDWNALAAAWAAEGRPAADAACLRVLRDALRTPRGRSAERFLGLQAAAERRSTADEAEPTDVWRGYRATGLALMNGRLDADAALRLVRNSGYGSNETEQIAHRTALYEACGHQHDLGRVYITDSGSRIDIWRSKTGRSLAGGATLREAAEALRKKLDRDAAAKGGKAAGRYSVRYTVGPDGRREYGVYRRHAGRWRRVRKAADAAAGRRTIADESEALDAEWERWRTLPPERPAHNLPRTPTQTVQTADPDAFDARFGMCGVQWGNWVENDRRGHELAAAAQALEDLAAAVGWNASSLSLGRTLALAFGARGNGGRNAPLAHYEPDLQVIAITKARGAGSLAHEWFHALDYHTAAGCGGRRGRPATELLARENAPTPLGRLLRACGGTLRQSGLAERSRLLDRRRPARRPYWSTTREMAARAFEAWVRRTLARAGVRNDYLVNFHPPEDWTGDPDLEQPYPYPFDSELDEIDVHLRQLAALDPADGQPNAERPAATAGAGQEPAEGPGGPLHAPRRSA